MKNAAPWVSACIQSIIDQSHSNWELLIVDDHSTDDSIDHVKKFQLDPRIKLIINNGVGIIQALETAWKLSSGTYITRMDADDKMPLNKLDLFVSALSNTQTLSVVTGHVHYFSNSPISEGYKTYENWLNQRCIENDHWKEIYRECVIASPNWMVHRSIIAETNGFHHLSYPEDYDLIFNWYKRGLPIIPLPAITLYWREHQKRTSRNSEHYQQEAFFKLKTKHFIEHELSSNSRLVLLGGKKKGKLTASLLFNHQIEFEWYDLIPSLLPYNGKQISPLSEALFSSNCKIIISVYPEGKAMLELIDFLENQNMQKGKNYWFF